MFNGTPPTDTRHTDTLFRQEALERLSSPERLDALMQVVSPKSWLAVVTFACLIGVVLTWAVLGRLPTMVQGHGVLIRPRQVVDIQMPASGHLDTLAVHTGDVVKQGDVLGRIDQPELRQRLHEERAKLAALQKQDQEKQLLQQQQAAIPGGRPNPVTTATTRLAFRKHPYDNTPLTGTF